MRYEIRVQAFVGEVVLAKEEFLTFAEETARELHKDFDVVAVDDVEAGRQVLELRRQEGVLDGQAG